MIDLLIVTAFVVLPVITFVVTRSLTWTVVGLAFGIGVAGNAVQSLVSLGMSWNVRGLQGLAIAVMIVVALAGVMLSRRAAAVPGHPASPMRGSLRQQFFVVIVPALLIGAFLIAMRVLAPDSPGPLTAVGYLVNHPQAEDNAKWLHLGAQLADGRAIEFSGYAGGPLLLLMSLMAALISVLSMIMLGGVNEVAVAVNAVVGTQFLLIALVPFALAPFAERRMVLRSGLKARAPAVLVWLAALVLFLASSVVTSFGHLSLQFVLLVLVLWSTVFILAVPGRSRIAMMLVVVCTASVWIPLNVLGLGLLAVALVWSLRQRDWWSIGAVVLTLAAVWDALISSTLFLLGIQVGSSETDTAGIADQGAPSSIQSALDAQAETARSLFTAPGGVEQVQPILAGLALVSVVFAVWLLTRDAAGTWRRFARFAPIAVVGGYLLLIMVADAVMTGAAPHYGGHKLAFAFTIMALASTLPVAISGLDGSEKGMTATRWFAAGGVVLVLVLDTILPRAVSALSPVLWATADPSAPPHWSVAEVKPVPDQPISSLPIACLFAPPESELPTALPLGQQAYNCTRMLLGMNGLEGEATVLVDWLRTDWLSNEPHWDDFYAGLSMGTQGLAGRTVVLMGGDGEVAGLTTLGTLLDRYSPVSTTSE